MDDKRPEWPHKTPEELARWIIGNSITKITHHWTMTGPDTSRDWIVLHSEKDSREVSRAFLSSNSEFEFAPDHTTLVQERVRYLGGEPVRKTITAIDAWEKKNKRDRSEYERLKAKFET